jgi:hypothetical protein
MTTVRDLITLLEQYDENLPVLVDDFAGSGSLVAPIVRPLRQTTPGSITAVQIMTPAEADAAV